MINIFVSEQSCSFCSQKRMSSPRTKKQIKNLSALQILKEACLGRPLLAYFDKGRMDGSVVSLESGFHMDVRKAESNATKTQTAAQTYGNMSNGTVAQHPDKGKPACGQLEKLSPVQLCRLSALSCCSIPIQTRTVAWRANDVGRLA